MLLADYLNEKRQKQEDFAREIDVSQAAVTRYVNLHRIPRPSIMARIERATGGRVSASDFYPSDADIHCVAPAASVSQSDAEHLPCPTQSMPRAARRQAAR